MVSYWLLDSLIGDFGNSSPREYMFEFEELGFR
jgi:hypothetical protein